MSENTIPEIEEQIEEINPIVAWANSRPYWEKYIWKLQLQQGTLSKDQLQEAYRFFKIGNGILPKEELEKIDLLELTPPSSVSETLLPLIAIKGIENVNALPNGTEITFGPKLTVCYGANGSGKSGYGRIIASACFTRGKRKIYPNLKAETVTKSEAKAEFVIGSGDDEQTIPYTHGDSSNRILKRFSMFDSHSAKIQLDNENTLQFIPAQLAMFDKVNTAVKSMENLLKEEKRENLVVNPLGNSFGDTISVISEGLLSPDLTKDDEEILLYSDYPVDGEKQIEVVMKNKEALVKLNIDAEKKKFYEDRNILSRFKNEIQVFINNYSDEGKHSLNKLINGVNDKKKILAKLGAESFNDDIFLSIGSEKWKSLLRAAKELHDHEQELKEGHFELEECLLCHQALGDKEKSLFGNYWEFLLSTAATDLKMAQDVLNKERKRIEQARVTVPRTGENETIIKLLISLGKSKLVEQMKIHLERADLILLDWDKKIESLSDVDNANLPEFLPTSFDSLISEIDEKNAKLKDPKSDIDALDKQIIELQHRKLALNVKEEYIEYLEWLRWKVKANRVVMAGTKRNYTDERSVLFDLIVTDKYMEVFREECVALRADMDLQINKRGSDGKTLVSKKLSFSRDKVPSEVLSEGEQKVCAIADFLSEARLDPRNWGIIFDDPVTSLDHKRKDTIAKRLVSQADDRQVIVFTHDVTFLLSLVKYAEDKGVEYKKLHIRQSGNETGLVDERMPWIAENCKARKGKLKDQLQRIGTMIRKNEHPEDIEKDVKLWSESLRESWERAVEERLLKGTVERYRPSVETSKLKKLVITQELLNEVEAGMTETSKWIHDRAAGLNVSIPNEDELKQYIERYERFLTICK